MMVIIANNELATKLRKCKLEWNESFSDFADWDKFLLDTYGVKFHYDTDGWVKEVMVADPKKFTIFNLKF